MALKILDCSRVLPGGGCSLTLIGEPGEVLSTYAQHRQDRAHLVEDVPPGREPENQLQNVVSMFPDIAYIGDEHDVLEDGSIHIPGPGVLLQRFDEHSTTLSCNCRAPATGDCTTTFSGAVATCSNASCTACGFVGSTTAPGLGDREFLPEFLTQ